MKKGRLTKREQASRFKLLFEFVFTFRYAARPHLNLYAQTAIKLRYPQRLIEYALNKGYLDRYYEPKLMAKIYFLTRKAKDFLYSDHPLINHYNFEKGSVGEIGFLKHNLLVDTYFMLNKYLEVGLKKWQSNWLLRRLNKQRLGRIPNGIFETADSKKIAVEVIIEHTGLASLKHMVNFYQVEIETSHKYQAVLMLASCAYHYEHLRKYLFAIDLDFCSKAFILTEPDILGETGCCFYQDKLRTIEAALQLAGGIKNENSQQNS